MESVESRRLLHGGMGHDHGMTDMQDHRLMADMAQVAYVTHAMPATIEAEHWDFGGEDVAYGETSSGDMGGHNARGGGVDVGSDGTTTSVGWIESGDWLEYTVTSPDHADYDLIAATSAKSIRGEIKIYVNGEPAAADRIPAHGWDDYREFTVGRVHLHDGISTVRIEFTRDSGGYVANLDKFRFVPVMPDMDPPVANDPPVVNEPPITDQPPVGNEPPVVDEPPTGSPIDQAVIASDFQILADGPRNVMEGVHTRLGNEWFVWGGYDDYTYIDRAAGHAYNFDTGTWRTVADLPVVVTHLRAIEHDGKLLLFGGFSFGENGNPLKGNSDVIYEYDPATNSFREFAKLAEKISGHGVAKVGDRVHVLSGMYRDDDNFFVADSTRHTSLDLNNPAAGWTDEPDTPIARDHVGTQVVNGKIYIFGGQVDDDQYAGTRAKAYVFDPATKLWTELASMPEGRGHVDQSADVYQDRYIIVAGGNKPATRWQDSASDTLLAYDTQRDVWTQIGTMPQVRFGSHTVLDGNTFHILGGGDGLPRDNHWTVDLAVMA